MMATKNAISFNGNELLIKKKIVVAERFMKRQMESKAHQTNLACTLGNSSPKGLLSLKTIHGQVSSHVYNRKDVLQQIGKGKGVVTTPHSNS